MNFCNNNAFDLNTETQILLKIKNIFLFLNLAVHWMSEIPVNPYNLLLNLNFLNIQ